MSRPSLDTGAAARHRGPQSGFSLLEVLIAFVVLALLTSSIMRVTATNLHGAARAQVKRHAVQLILNNMDALGVTEPLVAGVSLSPIDTHWTLTRNIDAVSPTADPRAMLYRVVVTARLDDRPVAELATYKLGLQYK